MSRPSESRSSRAASTSASTPARRRGERDRRLRPDQAVDRRSPESRPAPLRREPAPGAIGTLNLEAVGVKLAKRGYIEVDCDYRTSVPSIYAAGDVIGFPALASTSMEQARVAVCHAFGWTYKTPGERALAVRHLHDPKGRLDASRPLEDRGRRSAPASTPWRGKALYDLAARGRIIGDTEGIVEARLRGRGSRKLLGAHLHRRSRRRARPHRPGAGIDGAARSTP